MEGYGLLLSLLIYVFISIYFVILYYKVEKYLCKALELLPCFTNTEEPHNISNQISFTSDEEYNIDVPDRDSL